MATHNTGHSHDKNKYDKENEEDSQANTNELTSHLNETINLHDVCQFSVNGGTNVHNIYNDNNVADMNNTNVSNVSHEDLQVIFDNLLQQEQKTVELHNQLLQLTLMHQNGVVQVATQQLQALRDELPMNEKHRLNAMTQNGQQLMLQQLYIDKMEKVCKQRVVAIRLQQFEIQQLARRHELIRSENENENVNGDTNKNNSGGNNGGNVNLDGINKKNNKIKNNNNDTNNNNNDNNNNNKDRFICFGESEIRSLIDKFSYADKLNDSDRAFYKDAAEKYNNEIHFVNSEICLNRSDLYLTREEAFEYIGKKFYDGRIISKSENQRFIEISKNGREIKHVNPLLNPFMRDKPVEKQREMFEEIIESLLYNVSPQLKEKIGQIKLLLYQQKQQEEQQEEQQEQVEFFNLCLFHPFCHWCFVRMHFLEISCFVFIFNCK